MTETGERANAHYLACAVCQCDGIGQSCAAGARRLAAETRATTKFYRAKA